MIKRSFKRTLTCTNNHLHRDGFPYHSIVIHAFADGKGFGINSHFLFYSEDITDNIKSIIILFFDSTLHNISYIHHNKINRKFTAANESFDIFTN